MGGENETSEPLWAFEIWAALPVLNRLFQIDRVDLVVLTT